MLYLDTSKGLTLVAELKPGKHFEVTWVYAMDVMDVMDVMLNKKWSLNAFSSP